MRILSSPLNYPPARALTRNTDADFLSLFLPEMFSAYAGGSAAAAGELVLKQGGKLLQYLFIAEVTLLEGSAKLNAPVYTVLQLTE